MRTLLIELKKCRRSGTFPILLTTGIAGALYAIANFLLRKDSLLSLPLPPMVILLTQLYGVMMVINMVGVIVATCLIYHIEHRGNAMKKMYMLPCSPVRIYLVKFLIMTVLLLICVAIQFAALMTIGIRMLPTGTFEPVALLSFAGVSFLSSLPVLSLMLFVSSRCENMWITLGIGVAGFFSGLSMAMSSSKLFYINPFVLMMRPAVSPSIEADSTVLAFSIILTLAFLMAGMLATKYMRYE